MLQFTAFSWLAFPAGIGLLGVIALWRSRARPRAVPSTKLWQGLEGAAGKGTRRHVDPLWLLILVAAVLAALCLAGPHWVTPASVEPPVQWAARSFSRDQHTHAELWLQWKEAPANSYTLSAQQKEIPLTGQALRGGTSLPLNAESEVTAQLQDSGGHVIASETFRRPAERGFSLLTLTGPGRAIDPALDRAFAVQRGAVRDDPTLRPAVLLANDPGLGPTDAAPEEAQLVVAEPDTPLPGITLGDWLTAPQEGWEPLVAESSFKWPAFVSLKAVRIKKMRAATFSSDWQILASAGGHPFLALRTLPPRQTEQPRTWLWMASEPVTHTQWPADPSFVLFFTELKNRLVAANPDSGIAQWAPQTSQQSSKNSADRPLTPYLGALAIALLVTASLWYLYRARIPSSPA